MSVNYIFRVSTEFIREDADVGVTIWGGGFAKIESPPKQRIYFVVFLCCVKANAEI